MEEDQPIMLPTQAVLDAGPERFDPTLLAPSPAARVAWFEKECSIEHLSLLQARDAILRPMCSRAGRAELEPAGDHGAGHGAKESGEDDAHPTRFYRRCFDGQVTGGEAHPVLFPL